MTKNNLQGLLVGPEEIQATGISAIIPEMNIAYEKNPFRAVEQVGEKDIVFFHYSLSEKHYYGFKHLRRLTKKSKRVLVMGNPTTVGYIGKIIRAGSKGYFPLNENENQLRNAVENVQNNEVYLDTNAVRKILSQLCTFDEWKNIEESFGDDEIEVAVMTGLGVPAKRIAKLMRIKEKEVKKYTKRKKIIESTSITTSLEFYIALAKSVGISTNIIES